MSKYRIDYTQVPVLGVYDKHLAHYGRMKNIRCSCDEIQSYNTASNVAFAFQVES